MSAYAQGRPCLSYTIYLVLTANLNRIQKLAHGNSIFYLLAICLNFGQSNQNQSSSSVCMITRSNVNHPDVSGHCFYDNSPKSGLTCHSKMLSCLIIIQNLDSNVLIMLFEEARRHIIALVIHTHTHKVQTKHQCQGVRPFEL